MTICNNVLIMVMIISLIGLMIVLLGAATIDVIKEKDLFSIFEFSIISIILAIIIFGFTAAILFAIN